MSPIRLVCRLCPEKLDAAFAEPNGLNVRSGAGMDFDMLGQIGPDENGVIVGVVSSDRNWLKTENAQRIEGESPFLGSGWVFSSLLATNTRMKTKLYSRPDTKSRVLASLPGDKEVTLVACKGGWAKVKYGRNQGWQCLIQTDLT